MVLCHVGADNHDAVSISQVDIMIGHGPSAEAFRQTGDGRGMSETGTVFQIYYAEGTVHLCQQVTLFIVKLTATKAGDSVGAVS